MLARSVWLVNGYYLRSDADARLNVCVARAASAMNQPRPRSREQHYRWQLSALFRPEPSNAELTDSLAWQFA